MHQESFCVLKTSRTKQFQLHFSAREQSKLPNFWETTDDDKEEPVRPCLQQPKDQRR